MHLSHFITEHMEAILAEWEAFARINVPDATDMSPLALRNHARQMLQDIALDIGTRQSDREQQAKSRGQGRTAAPTPRPPSTAGCAMPATTHCCS